MSQNRFLQMQQYLVSEQSRFQVKPATRPQHRSLHGNGSTRRHAVPFDNPTPTSPPLTTSNSGLGMIKSFEGFRSNLYNDVAGHCTIGYGHLVHSGNCNGTEPDEFRQGITEERATALLRERLGQFEGAINRSVTVPLNQHQFDALVSFVFNVGPGAFSKSTLLRELNVRNFAAVPVELRKWIRAGGRVVQGLVTRREKEAVLFERGEYPLVATAQSVQFSPEFYNALQIVSRELGRVSHAFTRVSYTVPGNFNVLRQPSGMTCWATVATMMECWRDNNRCRGIEDAMGAIGTKWRDRFRANQGLSAAEKEEFLRDAGMAFEYPQSLTAEGWEQLMRTYGPIWVTTDEDPNAGFAIHARILKAIEGDGTATGTTLTFIDPASGTQVTETFGQFLEKYESEARTPGRPLRIQIVHYGIDQIRGRLTTSQSRGSLGSSSFAEMYSTWRSMQFSNDIPLSPASGGMSIAEGALRRGDIILSTTTATVSSAIRAFTRSPISHASVYVGDGIVEATGDGVNLVSLANALADDSVAVAFRHPQLTHEKALELRDFLGQQIGKSYNYWGVASQAMFRIQSSICDVLPTDSAKAACRSFYGKVYLGTPDNQTFFCSQLVLEAFSQIGLPLTSTPANWGTPADIASLSYAGNLNYVGHLKTP